LLGNVEHLSSQIGHFSALPGQDSFIVSVDISEGRAPSSR
jgi:hypothetical protein